MYTAIDLSKYIITKCVLDGCPISNLQLQKILYYIQKEYIRNDKCAFPDNIEAWRFGPVVRNVYYFFCGYGAMPITMTYQNCTICRDDELIINPIIEAKRKLDPWEMVEETHNPNGAWAKTYDNGLGNYSVISVGSIKENG